VRDQIIDNQQFRRIKISVLLCVSYNTLYKPDNKLTTTRKLVFHMTNSARGTATYEIKVFDFSFNSYCFRAAFANLVFYLNQIFKLNTYRKRQQFVERAVIKKKIDSLNV